MRKIIHLILLVFCISTASGQNPDELGDLKSRMESMNYEITALQKAVDDLTWYNRELLSAGP